MIWIKKIIAAHPLVLVFLVWGTFAAMAHTISTLTPQEQASSGVASDGTVSADLDLQGIYSLIDWLWIEGDHETTETAPQNTSIRGKSAWGSASSAVNSSDLAIIPGDNKCGPVINEFGAGTAGDTLTLVWQHPENDSVSHTYTEGVDFDCSSGSVTSIDDCVNNIATAIDGSSDTSVASTCTFEAVANTTDDIVEIYPHGPCFIDSWSETGDLFTGSCGGNPGAVWIASDVVNIGDASTGLIGSTNTMSLRVNGNVQLSVNAGIITAGDDIELNTWRFGSTTQFAEMTDPSSGGSTSSRSLGSGDFVFSDNVEIDGTTYLDGSVVMTGYTRHIDVDVNAAGVGVTAPTRVTWGGIARGLAFDADAEEAFLDIEVPSDWDAASDLSLCVEWVNEEGVALADTETVKWDMDWRSAAVGEDINAVAVSTATATYTQTGAGTDGEYFETCLTIDYDDATNPLAVNDALLIQIDRDFSADTYASDAVALRFDVKYTSIGIPTH